MWSEETIRVRWSPDIDAYRKDYRDKKPRWKEDSEALHQEEMKLRNDRYELEQRLRRVRSTQRAATRRAASQSKTTQATQKEKMLVLGALNNPEYEWRTIPGIAEETGLDSETVANALSGFKAGVVRSSRFTRDGRALYTTRSRYEEATPFWRKVLGAVKNEID